MFVKSLVIHQSIPAAGGGGGRPPPPPPRAPARRLPALSVPKVGHLQILLCPGPGHLPTPRVFQSFWYASGFLSEYNYTEDFTGTTSILAFKIVKDRKKLERVVKTYSRFYASIFSLLIKTESHGEIGSYQDVNQRFIVKLKLNQISVDIIWISSLHIYKTIPHNI